MDSVNFENYSVEELLEAFSTVDDSKYPDRADALYLLLKAKTGKNDSDLLAENESTGVDDLLPCLTVLSIGVPFNSEELADKIKRVLKRRETTLV